MKTQAEWMAELSNMVADAMMGDTGPLMRLRDNAELGRLAIEAFVSSYNLRYTGDDAVWALDIKDSANLKSKFELAVREVAERRGLLEEKQPRPTCHHHPSSWREDGTCLACEDGGYDR